MNKLNLNSLRQDVFERLQEDAVQILSQPRNQEVLGEDFEHVVPALESTFMVPRIMGRLSIPSNQADRDNIGIHPILPCDTKMPSLSYVDFLRNEDKQYLDEHDTDTLAEIANETPQPLPGKPLRLTRGQELGPVSHLGYRIVGVDKTMYERPLITISVFSLKGITKVLQIAVLAHEIDHAVRYRDVKSDPILDSLLSANPRDVVRSHAGKVLLERSAYDLTARLITGQSTQHDNPFVPVVAQLTSREAGRHANELHNSPSLKNDHRLRMLTTAQIALAFTEVFGEGSEIPTSTETNAYRIAGFIKT